MGFFSRMSPLRAYRDLRVFLAQREPYELGFLVAAMAITGFLIFAFLKDSHFERPYKRNIVYVEQWNLDRTDAEIRAQQAIDGPIKERRIAEQKAREEKLRQQFKKIDDAMTRMGI